MESLYFPKTIKTQNTDSLCEIKYHNKTSKSINQEGFTINKNERNWLRHYISQPLENKRYNCNLEDVVGIAIFR